MAQVWSQEAVMKILECALVGLFVVCGLFIAAAVAVQLDAYLLRLGVNVAEWRETRIIGFFTIWLSVPILGILVLHRYTNLFND